MNRSNSNVGLKTREVEGALKVKIATELPTDRTVQVCVNRGEAVVLSEPRAEFSKALSTLAKQVAPAAAPTPKPQQKRRLSLARA
jgi:MinD-like ATPase involved in chromosome partitioning or flagellar assembly